MDTAVNESDSDVADLIHSIREIRDDLQSESHAMESDKSKDVGGTVNQ